MKSYLWTAAILLAAVVGVLTQTKTAWAADAAKEAADATTKQEVWDTQLKYASYGGTVVVFAGIAYWVLSNANQRKKSYFLELKKQDRLDPNEGMPLG